MVREHGGVEAARLLLRGAGTAGGFTVLWEKNQLGRSSEATMLRAEYADLFTPDELLLARRRLEEHGFDVDAHLRRSRDRGRAAGVTGAAPVTPAAAFRRPRWNCRAARRSPSTRP